MSTSVKKQKTSAAASAAPAASSKASAQAAAAAAPQQPALPLPIDTQQVKSCLLALYADLSRRQEEAPTRNLIDEDEEVALVVALNKTPQQQSNKPIQIPIPHSLYDPATNPGSEICLFTKDPPAPTGSDAALGVPAVNPIKAALAERPVAGVTKVLPISKLRKNYHQFGERRKLLASYSLFLTDDRIVPLLPPLLGAKFYEKKRQPVPVNLSQHNLQRELTRARDATYMYLSSGPCVSVRIGRSSFSRAQVLANVLAALPAIVAHLPGKAAAVQSVHLKMQNSIALPIFNSLAPVKAILPDAKPQTANKASSSKKKQAGSTKKADSTKKAANGANKAASSKKKKAEANGSASPAAANGNGTPKKGKKRALSTKKEDKPAAAKEEAKQEPAAKKQKQAAAAAPTPAPAAAAAPATPAGKKQPVAAASAKRARAESDDAAPAAAAAAAPSAKKAKKAAAPAEAEAAPAPVSTPAKPKAAPKAQSAVKPPVTPKASTSTKKAPATAASKKK